MFLAMSGTSSSSAGSGSGQHMVRFSVSQREGGWERERWEGGDRDGGGGEEGGRAE